MWLALTWITIAAPTALADDLPLAVPYGAEPPPRSAPTRVATPTMTAETLAAIRAYKAQRLAVRPITSFQGGYTMMSAGPAWGWGWGYPGRWGGSWGGWGYGGVYTSAPTRVDSWAVYQGAELLETPAYLRAVGREDAARAVERRVRANRGWSAALVTTGVVGSVATVGGLIAMDLARSEADLGTATAVTLGGLTAATLGLLTSTGPANRARNLRTWPRLTVTQDEASADVAAYNEQLRERLGLAPERVHEIERED